MTFRSVDSTDAKGADFVVCTRVADMPPISAFPSSVQPLIAANRKDSTRQPCEGCGETILVSAGNPDGIPRICTHCHKDVRRIANRAMGKPS